MFNTALLAICKYSLWALAKLLSSHISTIFTPKDFGSFGLSPSLLPMLGKLKIRAYHIDKLLFLICNNYLIIIVKAL